MQDVIDWQTPPFDIYLGLMSARFGTPNGPFGSGTEKEFSDALQQWRGTGRPRILFYSDAAPKPSMDPQEAQQWPLVCQFRKRLEGLGLIATYRGTGRGKQSFPNKLDQHLRQVVHELLHAPPCPALPPSAAGTPSVSDAYRRWLQSE